MDPIRRRDSCLFKARDRCLGESVAGQEGSFTIAWEDMIIARRDSVRQVGRWWSGRKRDSGAQRR